MFYLHLKLREKSQSDMYCGTEGVIKANERYKNQKNRPHPIPSFSTETT